jgi:hypothetical protein
VRARVRHDVRKYKRAWTSRTTDHTGERLGRLLFISYHGHWRKHVYWKASCDCGKEVLVRFEPTGPLSCGCLNRDRLRQGRDWRVEHADGQWRGVRTKPVRLQDGRQFASISEMARVAGVDRSTMIRRMQTMPEERWLEPGNPVGWRGHKHRKRLLQEARDRRQPRRPQPWSAANLGPWLGRKREG